MCVSQSVVLVGQQRQKGRRAQEAFPAQIVAGRRWLSVCACRGASRAPMRKAWPRPPGAGRDALGMGSSIAHPRESEEWRGMDLQQKFEFFAPIWRVMVSPQGRGGGHVCCVGSMGRRGPRAGAMASPSIAPELCAC